MTNKNILLAVSSDFRPFINAYDAFLVHEKTLTTVSFPRAVAALEDYLATHDLSEVYHLYEVVMGKAAGHEAELHG